MTGRRPSVWIILTRAYARGHAAGHMAARSDYPAPADWLAPEDVPRAVGDLAEELAARYRRDGTAAPVDADAMAAEHCRDAYRHGAGTAYRLVSHLQEL
jgi:hypothetical protein